MGRRDRAEPDSEHSDPVIAAANIIRVVVPVHHELHPHRFSQIIDGCETVPMATRRLVTDEDVGALIPQRFVIFEPD